MIRPATHLPADLIAIVSHLELQHTAFWSDAVQSVVLTALYQAGSPLSRREIRLYIKSNYTLEMGEQALDDSLVNLEGSYQIAKLADGRFKLADDAAARVKLATAQWQVQRKAAQDLFSRLVHESLPETDVISAWNKFDNELLTPVIIRLGVSAWAFLINDTSAFEESLNEHLGAFLRGFPEGEREAIRRAVLSFLDPEQEDARHFVADTLNAYMFMTACGLSIEQIEYIEKTLHNFLDMLAFFDVDLVLGVSGLSDPSINQLVSNLLETKDAWRLATVNYVAAEMTIGQAVTALRIAGSLTASDANGASIPEGSLDKSVRGVIAAFLASGDQDYVHYFADWANATAGRPPLPLVPLSEVSAVSQPGRRRRGAGLCRNGRNSHRRYAIVGVRRQNAA